MKEISSLRMILFGNMDEQFIRCESILGKNYIDKLKNKTVAIFGLGGVGGYVVEALARSGISNFVLIDNDTISTSNLNRQIFALHSTIGEYKTEIARKRILDINKNANVVTYNIFYLPDNKSDIDFKSYDYCIDCIDTITSKIDIIEECYKNNVKIISSTGAGNKLDPTMLRVSDIYKTEMDPLAKVLRKELKSRNIPSLKVVYSIEKPVNSVIVDENNKNRHAPSSLVFVPATMGLIIAKEVLLDLLKEE